MVGFPCHPAITKEGEEEEKEKSNQSSKLKKSDDPLDFSIPDLKDLDLDLDFDFDFDSIRDWIDEFPEPYGMADVKQEADEVGSEKVEVGAVEKASEIGSGERIGDESGNLGTLLCSEPKPEGNGLVNAELGDAEKGIEKGDNGGCEEIKVEGPAGDESGKLTTLDCLMIEQEMGKVSLERASDGSVVPNVNGTEKSMGTVSIDENNTKSSDIVSDGDESDSDLESESASSSSSSSSSDDEEEEESGDGEQEEVEKDKVETEMDMEEGEIRDSDVDEMVAFSDDEDDEGGGVIRSKNEPKVLPPVPPVNVTLQPYHQMQPVGVVLSIIGCQVIVEAVEHHNPLNEGSILWITERRSPLGMVDEIFGPVKNPYYVVRYNSESEIPAGILQGTLISFVPEFANHVLNDKNLYKKGYDASGENDEELSDEAEFSDDEEEAEYKKMLKMSKRITNDPKPGNRKKDKKNHKQQGGSWKKNDHSPAVLQGRNWKKNDQSPALLAPAGASQLPHDQQQHLTPPLTASMGPGNCSSSLALGQGYAVGPAAVAGVSQLPHDQRQHLAPPIIASMGPGNCSSSLALGQGYAGGPALVGGVSQLTHDQRQHLTPPIIASMGPANCSSSSALGQGYAGGPALVPPHPQLAQAPGFIAISNGIWPGGACQQLQGVSSPAGFPTNGMPWLQQNDIQQPCQMPLVNGIPFQQQLVTGQMLPNHLVSLGGQSNFAAGPAFSGFCLGQSGFNQTPFGMCFPGQQGHAPMNIGGQGGPFNGLQMEPNHDFRPPFISSNNEGSQNFNPGVYSGRGRRQHHRGGGRFGGGRGRQQSK